MYVPLLMVRLRRELVAAVSMERSIDHPNRSPMCPRIPPFAAADILLRARAGGSGPSTELGHAGLSLPVGSDDVSAIGVTAARRRPVAAARTCQIRLRGPAADRRIDGR